MKRSNLNWVPQSEWTKKLLSVVLSMVLLVGVAFAQQKSISGKVTDESGAPVPGVTVVVSGTAIGTVTDFDGKYTLSVPADATTLHFSYIGMLPQDIAIAGKTTVDAEMKADVVGVGEVVVVGYGTRLKEELTGAVSTVNTEQLKTSTAPSVMSRIQGQISGVTVTTANRPGGDATIRIRGVGTTGDNAPLYVIDGVPSGPGNNLNPNDIESISVLKDASSAAIYGTRAANGVVLITTKRGKLNQAPAVNFNFRVGVNQASNQYDMLNTSQYADALWLSFKNRGIAPSHLQYGSGAKPVIPDYIKPAGAMNGDPTVDPSLYNYPDYTIYKANKQGTDWYDEIYRNGIVQEYDVNVSGGGQNATYAFSANYLDEQGYIDYTDFKRYTFRVNADAKFNKWFKAGESLQVIYIDEHGRMTDNAEDSPISQAYRAQPIIPVYDIMGNFAGSSAKEMGNAENPVAQLYRARNNNGKWNRILGNVYGEAYIMEGLTARTVLGFNWGQWNFKGYSIPNFEHSEPNKVNGMNADSNYRLTWNWTNTLNYAKTFAEIHKLNVVVGTEAIEDKYQWMSASRRQYFSEDPDYMQLNSGELNKDNGGNGDEEALFSVFGRINYDLMNKYFLEATFRRDAASNFSEGNRFAGFPAASLAWAFSEENFMANTKNWLDFAKLRLGWGKTGNSKIGRYNSYTTFEANKYTAAYALDGSNTSAVTGFRPSALGNEDVTWEATSTFNVGVDGNMFGRKLNVSFDIWDRRTTDMLFQEPIPNVMGVLAVPYINVGEMKNKGWDFEIGYNNTLLGGELKYNVAATLSHYKNEIVALSKDPNRSIITGGLRQMDYTRFQAGSAFPEFYGYIVDGIFQTQAEADAHAEFGDYNKPGHYKFRDIAGGEDGGPDGEITSDDRTFIGSPHPKLTGGLNIDLSYKNFDLNLFFYGSYGNKLVNYVTRWIDYGMFNGGLSEKALYETWGSPYLKSNADATLPMLDFSDISQYPSTAFVEDASFLRMKNLRLGYNIPANVLQRAQIKNLRVYFQASNLFTITKYSGLDPELNSSGNYTGLDQGAWPTPRQFMFGVMLGL